VAGAEVGSLAESSPPQAATARALAMTVARNRVLVRVSGLVSLE
jgi:hypothetical protein